MRFSILSILTATLVIALTMNGFRLRRQAASDEASTHQLYRFSEMHAKKLEKFASQQLLYERFLEAEKQRVGQLSHAQQTFRQRADQVSQFTAPHKASVELLSVPTYDTSDLTTRRFRIYSESANSIALSVDILNTKDTSNVDTTLFDPNPIGYYPVPNGENLITVQYTKPDSKIVIKINNTIVLESKIKPTTNGVNTSAMYVPECYGTDLQKPIRLVQIQPSDLDYALKITLSRAEE